MLNKDIVQLPELTFDRKRISANSNPNLNPNLNSNPNSNFNPNPKAQNPFPENEMTSFLGQVSRYRETLWRRKSV